MLSNISDNLAKKFKLKIFAYLNDLQKEEKALVDAVNKLLGIQYKSCIALPANSKKAIEHNIEKYVDQIIEGFSPPNFEELKALFIKEKDYLAQSTEIRSAKAELAAIVGQVDQEQKKDFLQKRISQAEDTRQSLDDEAEKLYQALPPHWRSLYNIFGQHLEEMITSSLDIIEYHLPREIIIAVADLETLVLNHVKDIRLDREFRGHLCDIQSTADSKTHKKMREAPAVNSARPLASAFFRPVTEGAAGAAASPAAAFLEKMDSIMVAADPKTKDEAVAAAQLPASTPPCEEKGSTTAAP
jgi:hypothetical protein